MFTKTATFSGGPRSKAPSIYNMSTEFVGSNPNSGMKADYELVLQSHIFGDVKQCRPLIEVT